MYTNHASHASPRQEGLNSTASTRRWITRRYLAILAFGLSVLMVLVTACGSSTPTGSSSTPTVSPRRTAVLVYFTRHPDSDNDPTKVFAVTRAVPTTPTTPTTATTTHTMATYALEQMFSGPTQAERAQGYYSPFDGQLALQSVCPGEFRDFDLTLDHRGPMMEQGTATLQFCRRVDIPGDLDGPRMSAMITSTLKQFPAITQVVILNYQGDCFDDMKGTNDCLRGSTGQQTGYPVTVYFSKHPDSDTAPTRVFPVSRTSPTLGVATYAISQLIQGPTEQEKAQGYYTPLAGALTGTSSCNGADFTIALNTNRGRPETGTATLQFCRTVPGFGDTGAAIVRNEITKTLTQFPSIQNAIILYQDGSCFDDLIGCG